MGIQDTFSVTSNKTGNHWLASLELTFDHVSYGTRLKSVKRLGPLSVQKAFYPEGPNCAHVYLLHPPAGIVSGDELHLGMHIEENAHALITTPGANRFYRAREDLSIGESAQKQLVQITVGKQGMIENLPLETIVYEGADGVNNVDIHLDADSVYMGWDITCLGLPASNQHFRNGRFTQLNRLFCDGRLIYHDRISITPENGLFNHTAGLADQSVFGSFIVYAKQQLADPSTRKEIVNKLRQSVDESNAKKVLSVTDIDGLLVVRYLGQHSEQCKELFLKIWESVRPICVGKPLKQPRIWFT